MEIRAGDSAKDLNVDKVGGCRGGVFAAAMKAQIDVQERKGIATPISTTPRFFEAFFFR